MGRRVRQLANCWPVAWAGQGALDPAFQYGTGDTMARVFCSRGMDPEAIEAYEKFKTEVAEGQPLYGLAIAYARA